MRTDKKNLDQIKSLEFNTVDRLIEIEKLDRLSFKNTIGLRYNSEEFKQTNNNSGCKNDRRIKVEISFEDMFLNGSNMLFAFNDVKARRKNWTCVWYAYNTNISCSKFTGTTLTHNNLSLFTSYPTCSNFFGTNRRITATLAPFSGSYYSNSGFVEPYWSEFDFRVTHQGMAGQWFELSR